jgi:lipopolysaccharide/colanic/teichoic acid biosynthesis glycosyltransferase
MKMIKRSVLITFHDLIVIVIALPVAIMLCDNRLLGAGDGPEIAAMLPMMTVAALASAVVLPPQRALWRRLSSTEIIGLAHFVGIAILLFCALQFLVDQLAGVPRSALPIQFLVALFGLLCSRIIYERYRSRRQRGRCLPHGECVLLVGAGDGATLVIEMMRTRSREGDVVGILADDVEPGRQLGGVPVLGRLDQFDAVLARLEVQGLQPFRVIVTRPHHDLGRASLYRLMERADSIGMPVDQVPDSVQMIARAGESDAIPTDTTIGPATSGAAPRTSLKRAVEAVVAVVALSACSPVLLVAATAIALGVQRPVLFTQIRPGLHGRPYRLLKLRTMRDPIDAHGRRLSDAERTPLVGRLLRRFRFDELPQMWNVVRGEMSLIGPRPLLASDLDAMRDGGRARSAVRPGITGWAQVNGGHQLSSEEKLALDLWYVANANLKLDLLIVWRTLLMVVLGERREPAAIANARARLGSDSLVMVK